MLPFLCFLILWPEGQGGQEKTKGQAAFRAGNLRKDGCHNQQQGKGGVVKEKEKVPGGGQVWGLEQQWGPRERERWSSAGGKGSMCLELISGGTGELANHVEAVSQQRQLEHWHVPKHFLKTFRFQIAVHLLHGKQCVYSKSLPRQRANMSIFCSFPFVGMGAFGMTSTKLWCV